MGEIERLREALRPFTGFDPPRNLYEIDSTMRPVIVISADALALATKVYAETNHG